MIDSDPVEVNEYQKGRKGDHLMGVPFECDLCHYRNIRKKDPDLGNSRDTFLLMVIRRANLDACWARATSTVLANWNRSAKDYYETVRDMGMSGDEFLPELGWPYLEDRVGMRVAVQTLNASLRPGKYANHLQYDAMRRTPTWWNSAYTSGTQYNQGAMFAKDERKVTATTSPVMGEWFTRFKRGAKLRMGQIRRQNSPFTSPLILALDKVCQAVWETSRSEPEKRDIEDLMCFVLMEYCGDLRGEEVPLLSLKGLLHFWWDTTVADPPYIMLTLHGKFKGETGLRWHCIPIPIVTKSDLPVLKWIRRGVRRRVEVEGKRVGWFFANDKGKRRKMSYYEPLLTEQLHEVKARYAEAIGSSTEVEDFSLWRSGRSGATTAATNNNVPQQVIETMGRWRKREQAKGTEAGLPMRQVYLRVQHAVPTLLQFASSF